MKAFLLAPGENWIVDRFVDEWKLHNADITTSDPYEADVIWLVADWAYDKLPYDLLQKKKVLASVHHIVPEKFVQDEVSRFVHRDNVTDAYHVPCTLTALQLNHVRKIMRLHGTKTPFMNPFWVNESVWTPYSQEEARKALGLSSTGFLVGSFQRDTEGKDLVSPKLEKGPDRFCDAMESLQAARKQPTALLGGWRRQYVMGRLSASKIPYIYNELPSIQTIHKMYAACDVYVVGSRYEGGPQAIFECAAMNVPIVSTNVGAATSVLHQNCIFDPAVKNDVLRAIEFSFSSEARNVARQNVERHFFEPSFSFFRKCLMEMVK